MALFVGTPDNDTITPAMISAGVLIIPADSDLTGDDAIVALAGDDVVEGDSGTDIAALGDGNDRFIWNPGDGEGLRRPYVQLPLPVTHRMALNAGQCYNF